jgi:hypothetical protein
VPATEPAPAQPAAEPTPDHSAITPQSHDSPAPAAG